jgi:hypothetical protein
MAEVVGLLQEGVGHLLREAGLALMNLVMEGRLLRGGRAEGADPQNPFAQSGKSRATAGQL